MNAIKYFKSKKYGDLIALLAGILMPFAFAPFRIFPLAVLGPALLITTWLYCSQGRAFWRGWLFGIGQFGVGASWVFVSIHQFGNVNIIVSLILTALFIAVLSLCPAISGYVVQRFFPANTFRKIVFVAPGFLLIFSWFRGVFFGGFPWLEAGYSQSDSPLQGFAPIIGTYGISLLVFLTAGLFVYGILHYKKRWRYVAMSILAIWVIGGILTYIPWTSPKGNAMTVSLLQGNISQSTKWDPNRLDNSIKTYVALTNQHWSSDLIIWPETAIPLANTEAKPLLNSLDKQAKIHKTGLLIGIPYQVKNKFYNALLGLGLADGLYFKRRLVPFGEFLPKILFLHQIYHKLNIPIPNLSPGASANDNIKFKNISLAAFICYEIAFPDQVRLFTQNANAIVVVSDDTWFGRSWASAQHLQMAQMQAMSVGRPILFDSNSGITAIINQNGIITKRIPTFKKAALTGKFQPTQGKTPYMYVGTGIALLLAILFILLGVKNRIEEKDRMS